MKIKTFYAKSMAEALRQVKNQFGRDALIVSTREKGLRSALGLRSQTAVEVVAAIDAEAEHDWAQKHLPEGSVEERPAAVASPAERACTNLPQSACTYTPAWQVKGRQPRRGSLQIDREYNEMRRVIHSLEKPLPLPASSFPDVTSYELYQDLVANEISEWLAFKLLDEAQHSLSPGEPRERSVLMRSVLEAACRLLPNSPYRGGLPGKRVVIFVGPTGVGKTTAAAKLGAQLALAQKKSVLLMTTDTCRIGAIEQLRTYAGLMGLPFRLVSQVADLPRLIEESSQRDYVLIDTAGRGQRDLGSVGELLGFLRQAPEIERHLVLSATTKSVDMHEIVDRFAVCNPDHLLFTKLDETSTLGPLFNELVRTQKPLSYFTDGQRVPEDLHIAQKHQIADILLNTH
jgi:flagellar biosynthesis protein FlhF